jgi:hypothetical protein
MDNDYWLRFQYQQGQKYSGTSTPNPWKNTTDRYRAWDEGFRGVPFSLGVPAEPPKQAKSAVRSLFD